MAHETNESESTQGGFHFYRIISLYCHVYTSMSAKFAGIAGLLGLSLNAARAEKFVRTAFGEPVPDQLMPHFVELRLAEQVGDAHCGGAWLFL